MYLVTGGFGRGLNKQLASTEILTEEHKYWRRVGSLPQATSYLVGVSVDNYIIIIGILNCSVSV